MKRTKKERGQLAQKRVKSVLARHHVANMRTLEQKISDAGPYNQRIDPHVLTPACGELVEQGELVRTMHEDAAWYSLPTTPADRYRERLDPQLQILTRLNSISGRIGQALEVAIYRALRTQHELTYFGSFPGLDSADDTTNFRKVEPPSAINDCHLPNDQRFDFLVTSSSSGWAAIEAKNVRVWLYPHDDRIRKHLRNAVLLDCVPVLICRRYPFVTLKMLGNCGVVLHQTYNQLLPQSELELATQAQEKSMLGYHDIRVGNQPDSRLMKFICTDLPVVLPSARERFEHFKDLIYDYGNHNIEYDEFAVLVLERLREALTTN